MRAVPAARDAPAPGDAPGRRPLAEPGPRAPHPLAVWGGILVLYVVWGSTYLGMKVALATIPPYVMQTLRFLPAGIILTLAVLVAARGRVRRPSPRELRDAGVVGALLLVGGTGLVGWGEQTIPTGIAALLIGLVPMWLAILGRVLLGERVPRLVAAGIAVGIAGIALLAWPTGGVGDLDPAGLLALLASPVLWSLGSLYAARRAVQPEPALLATGVQMLMGAAGSLVVAALIGDLARFDPAAVSVESWAGIAYLVVAGSLLGYTTYVWLLGVAPIARITTYAYVNPVVAVALGWLLLDEAVTPRTAVAAVVIVAAVALIVRARAAGGRAGREPVPAGGAGSAEALPGEDGRPPTGGRAGASDPG